MLWLLNIKDYLKKKNKHNNQARVRRDYLTNVTWLLQRISRV